MNVARLKQVIKAQNILINTLMEKAGDLKQVSSQTRSSPVKQAINAIIAAVETLDENQKTLHSVFLETEKAARSLRKPINDHLPASVINQDTILSICQELRITLNRQQEDINTLKNAPAPVQLTYAQTAKDPKPVTGRRGI